MNKKKPSERDICTKFITPALVAAGFVDEVFRSCGLPVLHHPAQSAYNKAELRAKIVALLGPG